MAINEQQILSAMQDELVRRAEQLVRGLNLPAKKNDENRGKKDLIEQGTTQASRALEVMQTAGSLTVFINWLRYQAGREASGFWQRKSGQQALAVALSGNLNWIQQEIARRAPEASEAEQRDVAIRAGMRLLGYFRRALIGAEYLQLIRLEKVPPEQKEVSQEQKEQSS